MEPALILKFIEPEFLIMVAVCYSLGLFIKAIPKIPDWTIPFILLGVTCVLTILYIAIIQGMGWSYKTILSGFIYGLLSSAVAVYGNQAVKQVKKKSKIS